ncbi:MAG: CheY-like chemotaxis protein [Candidatus Azotimanducaceae bacterium]|jgi:CheY-like chemotaxis protein
MKNSKHQILIVDDEVDIHSVTQLGLRGLKYDGKRCEFLSAYTGREALEMLRQNPNIAVVLLDVVMETDHAGLEACRSIRDDLGNHTARIILRTGQPGMCPEKETIDNYDIDGYLAKTEITATKLYTVVRTALKAWSELMELERHKASLALIHDCAMSFHSYDPLEKALNRILQASATIAECDFAILSLETYGQADVAKQYQIHLESPRDDLSQQVEDVAYNVNELVQYEAQAMAIEAANGMVFSFALLRELGHGWIYLEVSELDDLQQKALSFLCGHAANALYSNVAQSILMARQNLDDDDDFNLMSI